MNICTPMTLETLIAVALETELQPCANKSAVFVSDR